MRNHREIAPAERVRILQRLIDIQRDEARAIEREDPEIGADLRREVKRLEDQLYSRDPIQKHLLRPLARGTLRAIEVTENATEKCSVM